MKSKAAAEFYTPTCSVGAKTVSLLEGYKKRKAAFDGLLSPNLVPFSQNIYSKLLYMSSGSLQMFRSATSSSNVERHMLLF